MPARKKTGDELYFELARWNFLHFIRMVAPWYILEEFHVLLARQLEDCVFGRNDRLMVFAPPRAGKSSMIQQLFVAWYFGHFPEDQVMAVGHSTDLSVAHGTTARGFMEMPVYRKIFPNVFTDKRRKAGSKWIVTSLEEWEGYHEELREKLENEKDPEKRKQLLSRHGHFMAAGQRSGLAGHGFNLGIVDDPIQEHDATSDVRIQSVNDWWGPGFYTRRQPERNIIILIMTRWRDDDLPGYLLELQKKSKYTKRRWRVLSIPATLTDRQCDLFAKVAISETGRSYCRDDHNDCCGPHRMEKGCQDGIRPHYLRSKEQPLVSFAPRRWPIEELMDSRETMNDEDKWNAVYLQKPRKRSGQILPIKKWRKWDTLTMGPRPIIEYKLTVIDSAFEDDRSADYSAMTTWGVFFNHNVNMHHMILLEAQRGKWTFPELRKAAMEHYKLRRPDRMLIEKKASGHSLLQELRLKQVPVTPYSPPGGTNAMSKRARAARAGDVMESGAMWYTDDPEREEEIKEVRDECDAFPAGRYKDYVDTVAMATSYLRNNYWVVSKEDMYEHEVDEEDMMEAELQRRRDEKRTGPAYA